MRWPAATQDKPDGRARAEDRILVHDSYVDVALELGLAPSRETIDVRLTGRGRTATEGSVELDSRLPHHQVPSCQHLLSSRENGATCGKLGQAEDCATRQIAVVVRQFGPRPQTYDCVTRTRMEHLWCEKLEPPQGPKRLT